jgi:hypothetical protein
MSPHRKQQQDIYRDFGYKPARKVFGYEASGKKPTNLSRKYVYMLFSSIIWRNI